MLRVLGADRVGISTAHETIAARALGAEVRGVSFVTDLAVGRWAPRPPNASATCCEGR